MTREGVLSMTALDLDEVKDYVARKDFAYALLSAECEERVAKEAAEKETLKQKVMQMEILLKGRQSALIAKEQECAGLRLKSRKPICSVSSIRVFCQENVSRSPETPRAWLSVTSRMLTCVISPPSACSAASQTDQPLPLVQRPKKELSPPTVVRKDRRAPSPSSSSSSSSESPKQTRVRRSLERYRESFASVRSSLGVKSVSDDSDASLDELVSNAMRLSRTSLSSARSSVGSSVVRGSVRDSLQSVFPKRWK